jgi:outer membrane biosynthesis protein TonB
MRATALGFATEYAAAITAGGDETMSAQDIVQMAGVFLAFLADRDGAEPAMASVEATQPDGVMTTDQAEPAPEPAQPVSDQPAPSAPPVEPPPSAPPPPPEAPVPEQPAPATDQPTASST